MSAQPLLADVLKVAEQLTDAIAESAPGRDALFQVTGPPTSGKSSLLAEVMSRVGQPLIPVLVAPPASSFDTPAVVLGQVAAALVENGLVDGEFEAWKEPGPWAVKLATVREWLDKSSERVVLLIDEPERWPSRSLEDRRFATHAVEVSRMLIERTTCRRVVAGSERGSEAANGWVPDLARRFPLKRSTGDVAWLHDSTTWGPLADAAARFADAAGEEMARLSPLDVRLLVGLVAVGSLEEALNCLRRSTSRREFARALARRLEQEARLQSATQLWARLALLRRPFSPALAHTLGLEELPEDVQTLVRRCLLFETRDGLVLHDTLRLDAAEHRWLTEDDKRTWHGKIAVHYAQVFKDRRSLLDEMEAFYHATLASDSALLQQLRPVFSDQLDAMGREISRTKHDYQGAVKVFQRSLEWDDTNDYAHHYLAFNLDVQGRDARRVEKHYERAIELAPDNVWWHSRWVNYLITRGRTAAARDAWQSALDALGLPDPDAPSEIYENLHLWVARLLIHRGQLDFASEVLDGIPARVRQDHLGLRAMARLLQSLITVRAGRALFPLSIREPDWWNGPHLSAKQDHDGSPLRHWLAGRVDAVDEGTIFLVVAAPPRNSSAQPEYCSLEMTFQDFDRASRDDRARDLSAGRFVEVAYYGKSDAPVIRVHPSQEWRDDDLPPLFPDPVRYLRADGWVR